MYGATEQGPAGFGHGPTEQGAAGFGHRPMEQEFSFGGFGAGFPFGDIFAEYANVGGRGKSKFRRGEILVGENIEVG